MYDKGWYRKINGKLWRFWWKLNSNKLLFLSQRNLDSYTYDIAKLNE